MAYRGMRSRLSSRALCAMKHLKLLPAIALLGLAGCGGSGSSTAGGQSVSSSTSSSSSSGGTSSSSSGAVANQALGGLWNVASGNAIGRMLATADGRFFYFSSSIGPSQAADTVNTGTLSVAGHTLSGTQQSGSFNGHGEGYGINIAGGSAASVSVSGTVTQSTAMAFAGSTWTYDTSGLYDEPSSLGKVAGMWSLGLSTSGDGESPAIINASGALFQSDPDPSNDCTLTGQVSVIDPTHNAYAITLAYRGADCVAPILGATGSGLAYLDDTTTPVTLRYAVTVANSAGAIGIISGAGKPYQSLGGAWTATPPSGASAAMLSDYVGDFFYATAASGCTNLFQGALTPLDSADATSGYGEFSSAPSSCGGNPQSETYSGSLSPGVSLTLTNTGATSGIGVPINWTDNVSIFNQPSNLALLAGSWTTPNGDTIAIDASGNLSGSLDTSGCSVTGRLSIIDPATNVYRLGLAYSGCASIPPDLSGFVTDVAGLDGATVTGLASLNTSVTPAQLGLWSVLQFTDGSDDAIAYLLLTSN